MHTVENYKTACPAFFVILLDAAWIVPYEIFTST